MIRKIIFAIGLVIFILLASNLSAQNRTIQGKVVDKAGQPLIGVSVIAKETDIGALTDIDGNYLIEVPQTQATLEFSYTGFTTQEIGLGSSDNIDIILLEDEKILQEVVVTALGIKKEKAKLGYATQEITGGSLQKATEANVASSLTGRISGLSVFSKSNLFENPEIYLRGAKTLVVIDGVPTETDFWNISPSDIESVNVLKGTAAAALYGSLGINGAIMITTKKGKAGENGVEINFTSSNQFQAGFIKIPETQKDYGMGWNGIYEYKDGRGGGKFDDYGYVYGPKLNQKDPSTKSGFVELPQWNSPVDPVTGELVRLPWITRSSSNLDKFLQREFITTDNLSIAGKSDQGEYRISLSHLYQRGQVPNTHLNSTTATVSGTLKLTEKLKTQAIVSYNRQYTPNYPSAGYGADNYFYNILLWMGPEVDIDDMKNYWVEGKENELQKTYNYVWYNNPHYLSKEYLKGYTNDVVVGQANITYDFNKNLQFIARSGWTNSNVFTDRKIPYSFIWYSSGASPQGNYQVERSGRFQLTSDALLTWNKSIFNDLEMTVSAGASNRYNTFNRQNSNTVGLNIPGYYNLANSISAAQSSNLLIEKEVSSVYGYLDLNYKRMIYIGLTGRNDWTSALQKPFNSFFYPSASVGLIVSEMIKLPEAISYIKLRGSWADVSTDPDAYTTIPTFETSNRWNSVLSTRLPDFITSKDIKPNQTISQEYGGEIKLFKSRIALDATYFTYVDQNFIIEAPVSKASGYESRLVNGGKINRKGIELTLTLGILKKSDLKWDIVTNYSKAHRYRKEYYGGITELNGVKINEREDVYRGWAWQRSPDGKVVTIKGQPQYIDHPINLGYLDPDYVWGIGNMISYKKFSFNFLIDGRVGGKMYNGVEAKLYEGGMHPASANSFRDDSYQGKATFLLEGVKVTEGTAVWDVQGKIVSDNRKFAPNDEKVKYIDNLFDTYVNGIDESVLYDRTFFKLREAVITYELPEKWMKQKFVKSATISLVGRNLWLWTKVPFMDPDGYVGTTLAEPTYRNIGFNVSCKF